MDDQWTTVLSGALFPRPPPGVRRLFRFFFSLLSFFSTFSLRFVISGVLKRAYYGLKRNKKGRKNGGHFALYEDDEMDSV